MAEGKDTYLGLGVPLFGDFEMFQRTAATDHMTITGATSHTGDFIVCQGSTGTEAFVVEDSGRIVSADWPVFVGTVATTIPTTGLTSGTIFFYEAANVRQLAVADAAGTLWRVAMNHN
jgi:hypothetical protein